MPLFRQIQVESHCSTAFSDCAQVLLCLTEDFETKTICGYALAHGKIIGVGYKCAEDETCCPALPSGSELYANPPYQGQFTCVYTVEIDREAEFLEETPGVPYDITDEDVTALVPYPCVYDQIIESIKALPPPFDGTDSLSPFGAPVSNGHRHTAVDSTEQDILLISNLSSNLLTYNNGLYLECDDVLSCISDDVMSPYGAPVSNGHRHTNIAGVEQDLLFLSETAGNLLTYDDGLFLDCAALAGCGFLTTSDSLSAYGDGIANGHIHTASDSVQQTIELLSLAGGNLLSYNSGLFLDCAALAGCGFVQGNSDSLSAYGADISNGHRHTAVDATVQDIELLSLAGGNLLTYSNGLFLNCAALAACGFYSDCSDVRACFSAGVAIDITAGLIDVRTSGSYTFPGADTQGEVIYADSNNQLRTAPPIEVTQVSSFVAGAGAVPAPLFINVVNPSSTRSGWVSGGYTAVFNYLALAAANGGPLVDLSLDGAPSVTIAQMIGTSAGSVDNMGGTYLVQDTIDDNQAPIAPGGSSNFSVAFTIDQNGSLVTSYSVAMRLTVISV